MRVMPVFLHRPSIGRVGGHRDVAGSGGMMVAILLVALGIPLWLVAGMVLGALYSRHRFKQAPGVFRCKVRLVDGTAGSLKTNWGRAPAYGRWAHDVLLVSQGLALVRVMALPVLGVVTGPDKANPDEVKRLGPAPKVLTLRVDGDATIELAAGDPDELSMLGPFTGTALPPATSR
jgi:hypothetical protein